MITAAHADKQSRPTLLTRLGLKRLGVAGTVSLLFIVAMCVAAILASWISPYPTQGEGTPNILDKLTAPGMQYWFGTDHLGRDLFSRVLYGGKISISTGLTVVAVALLIGTPIGIIAGYNGGLIDEALMRITDIFLAFPALLLAVLMAAALGPGMLNCIIAVAVTWWPWYARLARAEVLVLRNQPYIESARLVGVSTPRILLRHILPATFKPLGVQAALDFGPALLTASALSFLGLGIRPPTADWGQIVNDGRVYFPERWWYVVAPGMAIFLMALAFSVFGDALRRTAATTARNAVDGDKRA